MIMHVSLELIKLKKVIESAKWMRFKFIDIDESEINELLQFQTLAITECIYR